MSLRAARPTTHEIERWMSAYTDNADIERTPLTT
jgi:hypothetical protein